MGTLYYGDNLDILHLQPGRVNEVMQAFKTFSA